MTELFLAGEYIGRDDRSAETTLFWNLNYIVLEPRQMEEGKELDSSIFC